MTAKQQRNTFQTISSRILITGMIALSLVLTLFSISNASVSKGRYFTINERRANGTIPQYYIWVPDSITQFKGVIVHHHGCGGDGVAPTVVIDYSWHYLAEKHGCIFVAPKENEDCNTWYTVNSGSFLSLNQAVDSVARFLNHPELSNVPYAIWGHSGGADWVAQMVKGYTSKIAVAVPRSAWYTTDPTGAAIKGVPMMWEWGGPNDYSGQCADLAAYKHGRSAGMPWAAGIEQNGSHDPSQSRAFAIPYMDGMLERRLPQSGSTPIPLDTTTMWYGCSTGVNQFSVYPAASFTGNKALAALLPNEATARHWRRAMAAAYDYWHNVDTTPPLAPVKLRATTGTSSGVILEWDLLPDIESCAKNYRIYRNGTKVYDWCQATGKSELQPTGGGDDASSGEKPEMKYIDQNTVTGATYSYEVTTINRADLESPRSAPLVVTIGTTGMIASKSSPTVRDEEPLISQARNNFEITFPSNGWSIQVFSANGSKVRPDNIGQKTLFSGLSRGVYFIHMTNPLGVSSASRLYIGR